MASGSSISFQRVPRHTETYNEPSSTSEEEAEVTIPMKSIYESGEAFALPGIHRVEPYISRPINHYPMPTPRLENPRRNEINAIATRVKLATQKLTTQRRKHLSKPVTEIILKKLENETKKKPKQQQTKRVSTKQNTNEQVKTKGTKRKSDAQEAVHNPKKYFKSTIESDGDSRSSN